MSHLQSEGYVDGRLFVLWVALASTSAWLLWFSLLAFLHFALGSEDLIWNSTKAMFFWPFYYTLSSQSRPFDSLLSVVCFLMILVMCYSPLVVANWVLTQGEYSRRFRFTLWASTVFLSWSVYCMFGLAYVLRFA